jgi:hypothetical protein
MLSEKIRRGMIQAQENGKKLGRPARDDVDPSEVKRLRDEELLSWNRIAAQLRAGRGTVLRGLPARGTHASAFPKRLCGGFMSGAASRQPRQPEHGFPSASNSGSQKPEYRDPCFLELDTLIAEERAADPEPRKGKRTGKGKRRRDRADPAGTLDQDVRAFTALLMQKYPERIRLRPKPMKKRVLSLLNHHLPPYPGPLGRPQESRISKALNLYRDQQDQRSAVREGKREKVDWVPIAECCIPGFGKIRSKDRRRAEVVRLRNSAYARLKREKRKKEKDLCRPD